MNYRIILIGTLPPPIGGDAIWAQKYLDYCFEKHIETSFVDTSLIGKRALTVSDKKNLFVEIKRSSHINKSLKNAIKDSLGKPIVAHFNINCSKFGTIRDYFTARILYKKNIKFVVHCHCDIEQQLQQSKIATFFLKKLFKISSEVFVLNKTSYNYANKLSNKRVTVMPNFVKDTFIVNAKTPSSGKNRFVFVGHIKPQKGVFELMSCARINSKCTFDFVGPLTSECSHIFDEKLPNVNYRGQINNDEIAHFLDQYDYFIFPSYTEGFSLSLLEAMSRGLPVICTDVGSNKDMIENKGGLIVPVKDLNSLSSAVKKIQKMDYKSMSNWNIKKVKDYYSISQNMKKILSIYSEILNNERQ